MTCLVFLLGTNLQLASRLDKETVTVRAGHRGLLRNSLQKGRDVAARYTATGLARPEDLRALQEGEAQPLSLASGDFNLDGFPDLARGSASSGAGLVTLHLGNPEAFAPSPLTIQALVNGQSPDSFLTDAIVLRTP
jgi:hypothetical protein